MHKTTLIFTLLYPCFIASSYLSPENTLQRIYIKGIEGKLTVSVKENMNGHYTPAFSFTTSHGNVLLHCTTRFVLDSFFKKICPSASPEEKEIVFGKKEGTIHFTRQGRFITYN